MSQHARTLETVRPRLPATPARVAVLAGDLLGLVVLFVAGLVHHGTPPLSFPVHTLETVAPFATAWLVLAPAAGLYLPGTLTSYRRSAAFVLVGWAGITLLGGLFRSTAFFPGDSPPTFLLVNFALGLALLLPWRLLVVAGFRRRGPV